MLEECPASPFAALRRCYAGHPPKLPSGSEESEGRWCARHDSNVRLSGERRRSRRLSNAPRSLCSRSMLGPKADALSGLKLRAQRRQSDEVIEPTVCQFESWCARHDSNVRLSASKADALSGLSYGRQDLSHHRGNAAAARVWREVGAPGAIRISRLCLIRRVRSLPKYAREEAHAGGAGAQRWNQAHGRAPRASHGPVALARFRRK